MKERVLVVCPGRGTYTAAELGYLGKTGAPRDLVGVIDRYRTGLRLPAVTELDQAKTYSAAMHATAEHAPALIYACSIADYAALDPAKCEVVAVTGNSMGWYIALAAAGALNPESAIHLIQTMGGLTGGAALGGQIIYPCMDDQWRRDPERDALVLRLMAEVNAEGGDSRVYHSIHLGGFRVIAGTDAGIRSLSKKLPPLEGRYPMKLVNHSAFHTELMRDASERAFEQLGPELFAAPQVPLVDGEGHIWQPYSTDLELLREYTLGKQVTDTYDFTLALKASIREFAPTRVVLLGPGSNLGGAIGQTLVEMQWRGIRSKADFMAMQEKDPYLIALGREEQRALLAKA